MHTAVIHKYKHKAYLYIQYIYIYLQLLHPSRFSIKIRPIWYVYIFWIIYHLRNWFTWLLGLASLKFIGQISRMESQTRAAVVTLSLQSVEWTGRQEFYSTVVRQKSFFSEKPVFVFKVFLQLFEWGSPILPRIISFT